MGGTVGRLPNTESGEVKIRATGSEEVKIRATGGGEGEKRLISG